MRFLKLYEDFTGDTEKLKADVLEFLKTNYSTDWFDRELSERVYDYVDSDDVNGSGDDENPEWESHEDYYKDHCFGGAVEYDILSEINKDIAEEFKITVDDIFKLELDDIINDYFIESCPWHDKFVFRKSGQKKPANFFDSMFGSHGLDWGGDDKENKNPLPDSIDGIKL